MRSMYVTPHNFVPLALRFHHVESSDSQQNAKGSLGSVTSGATRSKATEVRDLAG
jgi:hypothetical protein